MDMTLRLHIVASTQLMRQTSVEKKAKGTAAAAATAVSAKSPGPIVNPLDDSSKETFPTGRPLEDPPELQQCKHCKKSILKAAAKAHVAGCLKLKKERAQKKKEAREARVRAQEQAQADESKKDDKADPKDDDSDSEDEVLANKKAAGPAKAGLAGKKAAGKKNEVEEKAKEKGKEKEKEGDKDKDKKDKKRKAEAEADKGPKPKKKKEEPKPKIVKPKGTRKVTGSRRHLSAPLLCADVPHRFRFLQCS